MAESWSTDQYAYASSASFNVSVDVFPGPVPWLQGTLGGSAFLNDFLRI